MTIEHACTHTVHTCYVGDCTHLTRGCSRDGWERTAHREARSHPEFGMLAEDLREDRRGQVLPGCIPHVGCRWGGEIVGVFFPFLFLPALSKHPVLKDFLMIFFSFVLTQSQKNVFGFTIQVSVKTPVLCFLGGYCT